LADNLYQCIECEETEVVHSDDLRIDGRVCKPCKGMLNPLGKFGIDLGIGKDFTVIRIKRY
jgi:hypothetical protein